MLHTNKPDPAANAPPERQEQLLLYPCTLNFNTCPVLAACQHAGGEKKKKGLYGTGETFHIQSANK